MFLFLFLPGYSQDNYKLSSGFSPAPASTNEAGLPAAADSSLVSPPATAPANGVPARPALATNTLSISPAPSFAQQELNEALAHANAALQANPKDVRSLVIRGNVYAHEKDWDQARQSYQAALQVDPTRVDAKSNLAEIDLLQKNYAAARTAFAALASDPDQGDYFAYKVFLCDLFGGQEDAAAKELAAFNAAGTHASYYFANAAWDLFHKQPDQARGFLDSAVHIYSAEKGVHYSSSLRYLGYLPLPPPKSP